MPLHTSYSYSDKAIQAARALKWFVIRQTRPFFNALREPKALRAVPNKPLVRALLKVGIWPDAFCYNFETQQLYVPEWDAVISCEGGNWRVEREGFSISLDSEQAFLWAAGLFGQGDLPMTRHGQQKGESKWRGEARGFHFYMESVCDMNTAREVFIEREYEWFNEQLTPDCVVWDIGMNLGMASLLFAANEKVRHVYGYEPMPRTFDIARETLAGNPALAGKITALNAGIAASTRIEEFDYTPLSKAGTGMVGILPTTLRHYDIQPCDIQKIEARLLDADAVLQQIRAANPDAPIYVKCDCEGAEYEIIPRLAASGALEEIEALVVECHKGDPMQVVSQLQNAGFSAELETKVDGLFYHIRAVRRVANAFGTSRPPLTLVEAGRQVQDAPRRKAA